MYSASGSFPTSQEGAVQTNNQLEGQGVTRTRKRNSADEIVRGEEGNSARANRKKSKVWEHFEVDKTENGDEIARCNYCRFVSDGSSKKGTTHLWNHFKICPGRQCGNGNLTAPVVTNHKNSVRDGGLSRLDLVRKIVKHGISSIKADLLNVYHQEMETFRQYLGNLSCLYFLTIEAFFSEYTDQGYLCLSVLFIDDDWEPKNKIISFKCIESDSDILEILKYEFLIWKMNKIAVSIMGMCELGHYITLVEEEIEILIKDHYTLPFCNKLLHTDAFSYLIRQFSEIYSFGLHERMKKLSVFVPDDGNAIESLDECDFYDDITVVMRHRVAFCEREKIDPDFKSINLTKDEWDTMTTLIELRKVSQNFWDICKRGRYVTANMCFPIVCDVYVKLCHLESLGYSIDESEKRETIKEFKDEWWCKYNLVLATASVLDPRFKKDIVKRWYEKIHGIDYEAEYKAFDEYFTNAYHRYLNEINSSRSLASVCSEVNPPSSCKMLDHFGLSYTSYDHAGDISQPKSELTLYLEEVEVPRIEEFDILGWWRANSVQFSTLSKMARDVLIIPISDNYMEQKIKDVLEMEKLDDEMKEAFVCIKDWLSDTNI